MIRALCVLAMLAMSTTAHADEATEAFRRGQEHANAGRWAEACPLFAASYRADPQIGVLLHLADCNERIGKLATAWGQFNDAADLAAKRKDDREAIARDRATALAPKLSKLKLTAPPAIVPGLVVKRDGVDITVFVGSELAVDPGEHEISASAPKYVTWSQKISISGATVTPVQIPALEKAPEVIVKREGTLTIKSQPDAEIWIDGKRVGTGSYTGGVTSGSSHTLRVVAPEMRPYQTEVVVSEAETRTIDVPLDKLVVSGGGVAAPPTSWLELAAGLAPGVKLRNDNPIVLALRVEAGLRLGARVNFGVYGEYARIDTSGRCGTGFPGPDPATPFDFGPRTQFTNCSYIMPGLQLLVHLMPKRKIDPYIGISPGFRFGTIRRIEFFNGTSMPVNDDFFPAIVLPVRAGVTYHRKHTARAWTLGGFVEASIQLIGDGEDSSNNDAKSLLTMFAGFRSTVTF